MLDAIELAIEHHAAAILAAAVILSATAAASIACARAAWNANGRVLDMTLTAALADPHADPRRTGHHIPAGPCPAHIDNERHHPHLYTAPTDGTCWCPGWPPRPTQRP